MATNRTGVIREHPAAVTVKLGAADVTRPPTAGERIETLDLPRKVTGSVRKKYGPPTPVPPA